MDAVEWLHSIYIVTLDLPGGKIKLKHYFNDGLKNIYEN